MNNWINRPNFEYLIEWCDLMEKASKEYATAVMNNVDNKEFDPDKSSYDILIKYFPHLKETTP